MRSRFSAHSNATLDNLCIEHATCSCLPMVDSPVVLKHKGTVRFELAYMPRAQKLRGRQCALCPETQENQLKTAHATTDTMGSCARNKRKHARLSTAGVPVVLEHKEKAGIQLTPMPRAQTLCRWQCAQRTETQGMQLKKSIHHSRNPGNRTPWLRETLDFTQVCNFTLFFEGIKEGHQGASGGIRITFSKVSGASGG